MKSDRSKKNNRQNRGNVATKTGGGTRSGGNRRVNPQGESLGNEQEVTRIPQGDTKNSAKNLDQSRPGYGFMDTDKNKKEGRKGGDLKSRGASGEEEFDVEKETGDRGEYDESIGKSPEIKRADEEVEEGEVGRSGDDEGDDLRDPGRSPGLDTSDKKMKGRPTGSPDSPEQLYGDEDKSEDEEIEASSSQAGANSEVESGGASEADDVEGDEERRSGMPNPDEEQDPKQRGGRRNKRGYKPE